MGLSSIDDRDLQCAVPRLWRKCFQGRRGPKNCKHFANILFGTGRPKTSPIDMKPTLAVYGITLDRIWRHGVKQRVSNFESGSLNHSDTSPSFKLYSKTGLKGKAANILLDTACHK